MGGFRAGTRTSTLWKADYVVFAFIRKSRRLLVPPLRCGSSPPSGHASSPRPAPRPREAEAEEPLKTPSSRRDDSGRRGRRSRNTPSLTHTFCGRAFFKSILMGRPFKNRRAPKQSPYRCDARHVVQPRRGRTYKASPCLAKPGYPWEQMPDKNTTLEGLHKAKGSAGQGVRP